MNFISKGVTGIMVPILATFSLCGAAHADLSGDITVDLELGDFYNQAPTIPANLAQSDIRMPGTVGTVGYYLEKGVRHQAIEFSNGGAGSHLHGEFDFGTNNTRSQKAPDSGGGLFVLDDGGAFSLKTWEDFFLLDDLTVRGYDANGGGSFDVVLDEATYALATQPDFLALDSRFGNVNLVEYWSTTPGRGVGGGGTFVIDNIELGAPVPIPAALPLFLSGLLGVVRLADKSRSIDV